MDRCRVLVCLALCAAWHVSPTLGQSQIDMNVLARLERLEQEVSGQQYQIEVQSKLIGDLQTRFTDQESAIARQHATINEQQTIILDQQKTISEQQDAITKQQTVQSEQHRRLTRLEGILIMNTITKRPRTGSNMNTSVGMASADQQHETSEDMHKVHTAPLEDTTDQVKVPIHDTTSTIRRVNKRLVLGSESPVAFHAVNTASHIAHIGIGQNIKFPTVMLNLGSGYHVQHGLFISPAAGLYIISTSILSNSDAHSEIQVSLMKNGAILARAYGHGDSGRYDQGSVTIITQLAIGDEVWVSESYPSDASYYGGYFTSFTGCLLWSL